MARTDHGPIVAIFIGYLIYMYNKKTLVNLYPILLKENSDHWTSTDAGFISSSQQLSISTVTLASGILSDYIPARFLFSFGLIFSGFTTLLLPHGPIPENVNYFSFIWFLNGIGHGLHLNTALALTKQFSRHDTFGTNWSLVTISVNISGMINPVLTALLTKSNGWRYAVRFSGTIALATGVALFYFFQSRHQNESEIETNNNIDNNESKAKKFKNEKKSMKIIFPLLCMVAGNRFIVSLCRVTVHEWSQLFLVNELNMEIYRAGLFITTMEMASVFGKLISGKINDYGMKLYGGGDSTMVRLSITIGLQFLSAISLWLFSNLLHSEVDIITLVMVAILNGLSTSGNVITLSVWSAEIGSGLVTSVCSTGTKIGAFISGYPFTLLAQWTGSWYRSYMSIFWIVISTLIIDLWYFFIRKHQNNLSRKNKKKFKTQ